MHELKKSILSRIKPSYKEYSRMENVASQIIDRINIILKNKGLKNVTIKMVGSAARGTWLTGSHDLDIFISFPIDTEREELEKLGLSVGREVAKEADKWDEHYAEHPYIKMVYKGFNVDLVPCYNVSDAS
jgi:tRNA nucleotidyltransferase (CCA-adding enzyme)